MPEPMSFTFQCATWPSVNKWKNKHPMDAHKLKIAWLGTKKNRKTGRVTMKPGGVAHSIYYQWCAAGKPVFTTHVVVRTTLYFKNKPGDGRDDSNYFPKWLLDLIHIPNSKCGGIHFPIIPGDNTKWCTCEKPEIIEKSDRNYAVITITERGGPTPGGEPHA